MIQKNCPSLNNEYKFVKVNMAKEFQNEAANDDRDTSFKELMIKLKIDNAQYDLLKKGPAVSVMYRLNGVKVSGEDMEVRICDHIEAKKEERKQHEREEARKNQNNTPAPPAPVPTGPKNTQGGFLHVGGHT